MKGVKLTIAAMALGLFLAVEGDATYWRNQWVRAVRTLATHGMSVGSNAQCSPQSDQEKSGTDYIAIWAPIFLSALTLLILVKQSEIFGKQAEISDRQATILASQTNIQERQTDAAIKSQRATVGFKEMRIRANVLSGFERPFTWHFEPIWENTGQTPTKNFVNYVNWQFFPGGVSPNDVLHDLGESELQPITIAPKQFIVGQGHDILPYLLIKMWRREGVLLIWGWAEYNDGFSNQLRRTEFCGFPTLIGNPNHADSVAGFTFYGTHNGTDDECQHRPKTSVGK